MKVEIWFFLVVKAGGKLVANLQNALWSKIATLEL